MRSLYGSVATNSKRKNQDAIGKLNFYKYSKNKFQNMYWL